MSMASRSCILKGIFWNGIQKIYKDISNSQNFHMILIISFSLSLFSCLFQLLQVFHVIYLQLWLTCSYLVICNVPGEIWNQFSSFIYIFVEHIHFCPTSSDTLNGFIVTTPLRVHFPQTISNYLSGLKTLHSIFGVPITSFSCYV